MKTQKRKAHISALLLILCLLPLNGLAGVVNSSSFIYEQAPQILTSSSLTDGERLEDIRKQFEQAGTYQLGAEYLSYVNALIILQAGIANRFDEALENIRRLAGNERFVSDYDALRDGSNH